MTEVDYIVKPLKLVCLCVLLSFVWHGLSHSDMYWHSGSNLADSIRVPVSKYTPEYSGQVDRYDVAKIQNDPEVLVSLPKPTIKPKKIICPDCPKIELCAVPEEEVIVKTWFEREE